MIDTVERGTEIEKSEQRYLLFVHGVEKVWDDPEQRCLSWMTYVSWQRQDDVTYVKMCLPSLVTDMMRRFSRLESSKSYRGKHQEGGGTHPPGRPTVKNVNIDTPSCVKPTIQYPKQNLFVWHNQSSLFKIHNDLILAMDQGEVTSLILLDLSAAFDTVDHSFLLTCLQNWFGLDGLSLNWFSTYLSLGSQAVLINDFISAFSTLSKVPYLAHSFSLSRQLLLARWSQKFPSNIICTLMTPSCTFLSLLQILHYLLKRHNFQWHFLLDELERTASQSFKNWISSHWHKTTTSQIFWSNKLIS